MKLAGSLEKAQAIAPGQHAKARDLHYDLENELEHGLYDEDEADEGERAIAHLEAHHPGVREASRALTRPPNLSRPAKRNLDAGSSEPELEEPELEEPEREREPRQQRVTGSGRSRSRSRSRSSSGRVFDRATGGLGGDVSGAVIRGLQFLLAAGVVYQVLQPKGAGAFSGVLGGIGKGVSLLVDPVDPLGSSAAAKGYAQTQAALAAAGSPPSDVVAQNVQKAIAANPGVINVPPGTPGAYNVPGLGLVANPNTVRTMKAIAAHPGMVNVAPGTPGARNVPGLGLVAPLAGLPHLRLTHPAPALTHH